MRNGNERWLGPDEVLAELARPDGVVILPTDTVPGLHARIDRPRALERLGALKGRRPDQPFLVLCSDLGEVGELAGELAPRLRDYLDHLWPGPFTVIVAARDGLAAAVRAPAGTVAVRVPAWEPLRELLRRCGPLASTSANAGGDPPAVTVQAALAAFPELAAWQTAEASGAGAPSALVDLAGDGPRLLRPGPRPLPPWAESV